MRIARRLLGIGAAAALLAAVGASFGVAPAAGSGTSCGKPGYAYAGYQSVDRAHGVRATLRALANPAVESGHVAAWVGVGGPGQGLNGSDAWLQIGLSAFPWERASKLYYEVNRPGAGPVYKEVLAHVAPGRRHRVAVLETPRRDWWRVWVDGRPASQPIHLPASSGRWRPIATAEAWDGGRRSCNRFAYGFEDVAVAGGRGGAWRTFRSGYRFQDSGFRVLAGVKGTFLARTALLPPRKAAQAQPKLAPATPAAAPAPVAAPAPPPAPAAPPSPTATAGGDPAATAGGREADAEGVEARLPE